MIRRGRLHRSLQGSAVQASLACFIFLCVAASPARAGEWRISGYNEARWRMRATTLTDDQDLFDTLLLNGRGGAAAFHVQAGLTHDLEGLAPRDRYERFAGLTDTYADRTHGYLYSAFLDLGRSPTRLRLGRQWSTRGQTLFYDGASLELRPLSWLSLAAVGGQPVRFYESSPRGDRLVGGGARFLAFEALEFGADVFRIHDMRPSTVTVEDTLTVVSAALRTTPAILAAEVSYANNEARRYALRGSLDLADQGTLLTGQATYQPETVEELVPEAGTFWPVLGAIRPYQLYRLGLEQALGRGVSLLADGTLRLLDYRSDESAYNHDYTYWNVGVRLGPELLSGFAATVTGGLWQSKGGPDQRSLGLDLRRDLGKHWSVRAGTAYELFKYDRITGEERQDVRSVYARLSRKVSEGLGLELGWEAEQDETAGVQVFDVALRQSF